ncbi:MAG: helix-turn-helix domain-containing protein [Phycisphaerae bacterium]|nr:helix-turn-helix domain-containing protein [Phycisphaerae bacterium]
MNSSGKENQIERAPILWMHEAIAYLGLDRLGLAHPEQAIYRMVRKGILKPRKIGRFLAFSKSDLEYVITNGEKKRTPGRPRKISKIMSYENPV